MKDRQTKILTLNYISLWENSHKLLSILLLSHGQIATFDKGYQKALPFAQILQPNTMLAARIMATIFYTWLSFPAIIHKLWEGIVKIKKLKTSHQGQDSLPLLNHSAKVCLLFFCMLVGNSSIGNVVYHHFGNVSNLSHTHTPHSAIHQFRCRNSI